MAEWEETHNVYPLYALIHGGVVLSVTSDMKEYYMGFDSGQIGFVLVTKNSGEIPDPFGYAKEMVEVWNQYLSGDVWGYTVTAPDGEEVSCWGIYGFDAAIQEALSEVGKP